MKKIMLTGFEPFGQDTVNPSWEAVALLPEELQGVRVVRRRMPVEYDRVAFLLEEAIRAEQPDAVICVGQAGGRTMYLKRIKEDLNRQAMERAAKKVWYYHIHINGKDYDAKVEENADGRKGRKEQAQNG